MITKGGIMKETYTIREIIDQLKLNESATRKHSRRRYFS
jgi:hypothetical protein